MIEKAFKSLYAYVREEDYKGWDLFDGLNSTLFRSSPLNGVRLLRLAWIQFFKRCPINFRSIVNVPKDYNPKGLALFASGLITTGDSAQAQFLLKRVESMACSGYSGLSWGYNFDWESRAFYVPVGTPNIVSTVFVANAFLDYFDATGEERAIHVAQKACDFFLENLILFEDSNTLCFGYIPGEKARVHNANMLAAALLARVYSQTQEAEYYEKSKKAMSYAMKALKADYSWPYGERHHHQFVDNFHTGFNLVALREWMTFSNDYTWEEKLKKAYEYFLENFWLPDGCPKYYNNSLYPIDIHCSAQGVVTCLKLREYNDDSVDLARKIVEWAIRNMQDKRGYFYYQKTRFFTNRIPYIRWSQAWMFYALAYFLSREETEIPKVESMQWSS